MAVLGYVRQQMAGLVSLVQALQSADDDKSAGEQAQSKVHHTCLKLQFIIIHVLRCAAGPLLDSFLQLTTHVRALLPSEQQSRIVKNDLKIMRM